MYNSYNYNVIFHFFKVSSEVLYFNQSAFENNRYGTTNFSRWWMRRVVSSGLQYRGFWQLFTSVLEKLAACIFRPEAIRLGFTSQRNWILFEIRNL